MSDITKLPKWGQEIIASKDREIRDLQGAVETLRNSKTIDGQVGFLLQSGYHDEPIPLGRYFRVEVDGLEICIGREGLEIRAGEGYPAVIPSVSNVIQVIHLPRR